MTISKKLSEIKSRAERATEGPWNCERVAHDEGDFSYEIQDENCLMALYEHNFEKPMKAKFTAEFISASRTDVPRLVAALERALTQIDFLTFHRNGSHPCECDCMDSAGLREEVLTDIAKILEGEK